MGINIMKPPPRCNICNGDTEWDQEPNGEYVSCCYFCGHKEFITESEEYIKRNTTGSAQNMILKKIMEMEARVNHGRQTNRKS